MKIKFLGATGTVTGSCYRLSDGRTNILIDFGMFQGKPEEEGWNSIEPAVDLSLLSGVVLTHAHLDHCGRLPLLVKYGYRGSVFMTEATKALVELVLLDSAKLAKEDAKAVLYTEEEVLQILNQIQLVDFDSDFVIGGFRLRMIDAGHILGSASVVIEEKATGKKVVFSGDLGNTPEPLIQPTEWVGQADFAVMESTYGDKIHEPRNEMRELAVIVQKAEKTGGTVIIPAFSIERAQELLFLFDQLKKSNEVRESTPVFLDSPMAIKATEIFKDFPELFNRQLQNMAKGDDPFDFPGLVVCDDVEKSRQIKNLPGVKVIIAGSGMMTGGRVIHHAMNFLGDPKTQLVFVGYQAEGTMGRMLKDGAPTVNIWGNVIEVKAEITEITSMSSHADQSQLVNWLKKVGGLKSVFLIHGEELQRLTLMEKIRQEIENVKVKIPILNDEIEL
jgi:metallo-beta-lactamase family protein